MASAAQIKANQRNSRKSTGPKTSQGKLTASQNARVHGVFATKPLLPGENEAAFNQLSAEIEALLAPRDAIERSLTERIILGFWRQVRLREAEAARMGLSISKETLAYELNLILRRPLLDQIKPDMINEKNARTYESCAALMEELGDGHIDAMVAHPEGIEADYPKTYGQLRRSALDLEVTIESLLADKALLKAQLDGLYEKVIGMAASYRKTHEHYQLAEQLKVAKRIPNPDDLALLMRYQVQLDHDIYKAMDAFRKHREWRSLWEDEPDMMAAIA